jgi:hypothetical protein
MFPCPRGKALCQLLAYQIHPIRFEPGSREMPEPVPGSARTARGIGARRSSTSPRTRRTARPSPARRSWHRRTRVPWRRRNRGCTRSRRPIRPSPHVYRPCRSPRACVRPRDPGGQFFRRQATAQARQMARNAGSAPATTEMSAREPGRRTTSSCPAWRTSGPSGAHAASISDHRRASSSGAGILNSPRPAATCGY